MRFIYVIILCLSVPAFLYAQTNKSASQANTENIYTIKQQFLYHVLHNPNDNEGEYDNELARFNRWFHDVEVRTWPSGNLPRPDVILTATREAEALRKKSAERATSGGTGWQPIGPMKVPINNDGIGRVNCIVIDPLDTGTLYIGAACGGVFISHDGGNTWVSNSDNFPSLSIADIAVNPRHTDTIYAATGDGYGYEEGSYNIFWGGLYSAGVMMSADGGNTWNTTGLSYLQSDRDIIQKLLLNPRHPEILLAATRTGIFRSADAGATWANVDGGHVYSMAFKPGSPDTVYAINDLDLRVSYNAGATWSTRHAGINTANDRCTIAVSPAAPDAIWVLDATDKLQWSHNNGATFNITPAAPDTAHFYGYYDRVLSVSPADSNYVLAFGSNMAVSTNAGNSWAILDEHQPIHVDNHAVAINPLRPHTVYSGNDGGISVTYNGGITWKNLANGLTISQIYKMGSSQQSPYTIICGLQDNGSLVFNGADWIQRTGRDGEACAIHPWNDALQVSSWQNGHFYMSYDGGATFTALNVSSETAAWTAPVAFDPNNQLNIYFGYENIYVTHDQGGTFSMLTTNGPFANGATMLAVAPSSSSVIYAGDYSKILRSTNGGLNWTNVTGNLPSSFVALTGMAVDPGDPMRVYVTTSGYVPGYKVYVSLTGGGSWTNIGAGLPNIPANCIAIDSSVPGALFVGTDIGVYYTDSSQTGWSQYSTGLPNVIAHDLDINYANYKVRVATYGRGIWECNLLKRPAGINQVSVPEVSGVQVYPNPASANWKLLFAKGKPGSFTVKVTDINGRTMSTGINTDIVNASGFSPGVYNLDVQVGDVHYNVKAVKE